VIEIPIKVFSQPPNMNLTPYTIPTEPNAPSQPPEKKRFWLRRLLGFCYRFAKKLLKWTLIFLIAFWFLFKIPAVQNWLADKAAAFLASQLKTEVSIGTVEIELFNKVILNDLYIEDLYGDTLLYAREFKAGLNLSFSALWNKRIDVATAEINGGRLRYVRPEGTRDFNLFFLLRYFDGGNNKPKTGNKPLQLNLSQAIINNADIYYKDVAVGVEMSLYAGHLFANSSSDSMNLIRKFVRADSVFLKDCQIAMRQFPLIPLPPKTDSSSNANKNVPDWDIKANRMRSENIQFTMRNERFEPNPDRELDFTDLKMDTMAMSIDNFSMHKEVLRGNVRQLRAEERRGFAILSMYGQVLVSPQKVAITDFRLRTRHSVIGDSLFFDYNRYGDFFDFVNKVKMRAHLKKANIKLRDIIAFAPVLRKNKFFDANYETPVFLEGDAVGIINNLKIRNLNLKIADRTLAKGYISLTDITIPEAGFMDLSFEDLQSDYRDLCRLLPFVTIPKQLDRLGNMQFRGNYTGYFDDFVAYGRLNTDIGSAESDLKMNLRKGAAQATYSGQLKLIDFDLGQLLSNKNFGKIGIQSQLNGQGLTAQNLDLLLTDGSVDSFEFKKYRYQNILVNGRIQPRQFSGEIVSNDRNCDVLFKGSFDIRDTLPKLDFKGQIKRLDFQQLNLSQEPFSLSLDSFDIKAVGDNLSNLKGAAYLDELNISRFERDFYLDSLLLTSTDTLKPARKNFSNEFDPNKMERVSYIKLYSDIAYMRIAGMYDMVNLPRSLSRYVKECYPNLFKNLQKVESLNIDDLARVDSLRPNVEQRYRLQIKIDSSKNFTQLLDTNLRYIHKLDLHAYFNSEYDTIHTYGDVGSFKYGNIGISGIDIEGGGRGRNFSLHNKFNTLTLNDSSFLPAFSLDLDAQGDTLKFSTRLSKIGDGKVASNIGIEGKMSFTSRMLEINLDSAHLKVLDRPWSIRGDNYLRIGAGKLEAQNIRLTNENQLLEVSSLGTRGLALCVQQMDLGWLYDLVKLPQIDMKGNFSADMRIKDVFQQKSLSANIYVDSLSMNGDNWGKSVIYVQADSFKSPININFQHHSLMVDSISANGYILPSFATKNKKLQNTLDFDIKVKRLQTRIIRYFLPTVLSDVEGTIDIKDGKIFGQAPKSINTSGTAEIRDFATSVSFLKTRYTMPKATMIFSNTGFLIPEPTIVYDQITQKIPLDTIGASIIDERGNEGKVWGGIVHKNLQNFGMDLHFYLNNNLVMNTTKKDNSTFYGRMFADGQVDFTGAFNQLKLTINAKSRDSSVLVLPLDDPLKVDKVNYISFVNKKDTVSKKDTIKTTGTGLTIDINAQILPNALMQMILDEQTQEIMQGRGRGNMRLTYSSTGEFAMFGGYELESGLYSFKYQNLTAKDFVVKKGGTIVWAGNPYEAQLNIQAFYAPKVGVYNLISSYLETADANTRNLANNPVVAELMMNIRGKLLSPDITFDVAVPDVAPQLRSFVDLALRAVRENKNELNRQVFGLVALQQFLSLENGGRQSVDLISTSVNTFTELLSSQVSNYLTDLLRGVVDDVGFISSFEFDVDLRMRDQNTNNLNASNNRNSQLNLGLDQKLLDDKLRIRVGANLDLGNNNLGNVSGGSQNYIAGDFIVEYKLTDDGRLKIHGYNRTESGIWGRTFRSGAGISYRKEFDSFGELITDMRKNWREKREQKKLKRAAKKAAKQQATGQTAPTTTENLPQDNTSEQPVQ
jgi:TamB, inner membrane protein subunit of TAM complex